MQDDRVDGTSDDGFDPSVVGWSGPDSARSRPGRPLDAAGASMCRLPAPLAGVDRRLERLCAPCRRFWNPRETRERERARTSRTRAYLARKLKGDCSMLVKRKTREDMYLAVLQVLCAW